jgi:hypothetical protein
MGRSGPCGWGKALFDQTPCEVVEFRHFTLVVPFLALTYGWSEFRTFLPPADRGMDLRSKLDDLPARTNPTGRKLPNIIYKRWQADQRSPVPRPFEEAGEGPLGRTPARAARPSRGRKGGSPEAELRPAGARVRSLDRKGIWLVRARPKVKAPGTLEGKE